MCLGRLSAIANHLTPIFTMAGPSIGIIGMGLMGRMYAKRFSEAGYR